MFDFSNYVIPKDVNERERNRKYCCGGPDDNKHTKVESTVDSSGKVTINCQICKKLPVMTLEQTIIEAIRKAQQIVWPQTSPLYEPAVMKIDTMCPCCFNCRKNTY